jgi:imidazole glycerol-phosphate synthase subunit HisF
MTQVHVVQTGVANTAAICAALRREGCEPILTTSAEAVVGAQRVVLPGVGSFGAGVAAIATLGLAAPLRQRIAQGQPTLCVCLGLQLLAATSDETPGVVGLGVFDAHVSRFGGDVTVPQMGWNRVSGFAHDGAAYFANSFKLDACPEGWSGAFATHGEPFVAALQRGGVLACQFHPELSGSFGRTLLGQWLRGEVVLDSTQADCGGVLRRIIPCLDVRDGRVVKGVKFQGLRDAGDPQERAAAYEAQNADELVMLDVSATAEGRAAAVETVKVIRAQLSIPLTVGGGIRAAADAERMLAAGADKVSVNTAAVVRPDLVDELALKFGRQCTVVAIDARRTPTADGSARWETVIKAGTHGTGQDAVAWARDVVARGAGELLLTSWDRDGTRSGYDLELLRAVSDAVQVPVIASGGADTPQHFIEAVDAGAEAVLAASIFHDGHTTVAKIKEQLAQDGRFGR